MTPAPLMPPLEVGGTVLSFRHLAAGWPYVGRVEDISGDRVAVRMLADGIRRVVGADWLTPWAPGVLPFAGKTREPRS